MKMEGPKTKFMQKNPNNFEYDIIRVRDFYFLERPSWSGDFQQNANKVDFILKIVYIETLAENLTL